MTKIGDISEGDDFKELKNKLFNFHDDINKFNDFLKDNITIELKFWEDYLDKNSDSCVFNLDDADEKKYQKILYNRFKDAAYN